MPRHLLLVLAVLATASFAWGQEIRIGVVIDRSGPGADDGMVHAIAAFDMRMRTAGGVFGMPIEILVRDGRGDPEVSRDALEQLASEHAVHALVCCTDAATASIGVEISERHGILLLSLAPHDDVNPWTFALAPDARTELRAIVGHVYSEGKRGLGLMTLSNDFGDLPARVLAEELTVAGMELVAVERYAPNVDVLTPEALWVATRQPGAVVVWGLAHDTRLAVASLRQRGYQGPVYVRSALLGEPAANIDATTFAHVRFGVAPILVHQTDATTASLDAAEHVADFIWALYGVRNLSTDAARVFDALGLLRSAAEQAAVYGVSPDDVNGYRSAIRDAAIALPVYVGAGGSYDLEESGGLAALPAGLVFIELQGDRRVAVFP